VSALRSVCRDFTILLQETSCSDGVGIPIYTRESYAGFGNRPGLSFDHRTNEFRARYYINRAGFRVPRSELEYTLAKPSNVYRIMLLGDSPV
jgi:hypothetical protein